MKKPITVLLVCLLILFLATLATNHLTHSFASLERFNYIKFLEPEDLISNSDAIINGIVQQQSSTTLNINLDPSDSPLYINYTVSDILVTDVILGNIQIGDVIQVKYPTVDALQQYEKFDFELTPPNDVILFLKYYPNMPYSLVSPHQGIINLSAEYDDDYSYLKTDYSSYELFDFDSKEELLNYLKSLH